MSTEREDRKAVSHLQMNVFITGIREVFVLTVHVVLLNWLPQSGLDTQDMSCVGYLNIFCLLRPECIHDKNLSIFVAHSS